MNWYSVKLLYRFIISGNAQNIDNYFSDDKDIFEETVMLVQANSFDDAYSKAEQRAKENETVYANKYNQTVSYQFVESMDCYCIGDTIESGCEIYSNIKAVPSKTSSDEYIDKELDRIFDINSIHILRNK